MAAIVPDGHIDLQWFDGELRVAGPDRVAQSSRSREGRS